jgi:glycosyltransferase involved in cell wall biosynthesis
MSEALVSVLIRSTGRPMLEAALDSVAGQLYPNIEAVVVAASGGAHPGLPGQCGRFPLRLVGNGQPLARADAANFALDAARGEYCVFLDDDDYHDPDHVSGLMATLEGSPGVRLAYSRIRVIGVDGAALGVMGSPYDRLGLHERNNIQIGAALFDRNLAAEGCRFDPAAGSYDDWDFWLQCSERTDFAFQNRPTTNWRSDTGESGAGGGANFDPAINKSSYAAVRGKWMTVRQELGGRFGAFMVSGHAAQQRGEWQQAERDYWAALRLNGLHPDVLNLLAGLLYARREIAEAVSCLRLALRGHPDRTDIACNLARLEIEGGNRSLAGKLLETVLRRDPGNVDASAMLARLGT